MTAMKIFNHSQNMKHDLIVLDDYTFWFHIQIMHLKMEALDFKIRT